MGVLFLAVVPVVVLLELMLLAVRTVSLMLSTCSIKQHYKERITKETAGKCHGTGSQTQCVYFLVKVR